MILLRVPEVFDLRCLTGFAPELPVNVKVSRKDIDKYTNIKKRDLSQSNHSIRKHTKHLTHKDGCKLDEERTTKNNS